MFIHFAASRSPGDRVPWWVLIWIKRSPLAFLVLSVACFSLGLCFFVYASGQVWVLTFLLSVIHPNSLQSKVTSTITTVLTALTSFGLCAVSAWFATERWTFIRYRGTKWLDDVLMESTDGIFKNLRVFSRALGRAGSGFVIVGSVIIRLCIIAQKRLFQFLQSCSCVRFKVTDNDPVLPVSRDPKPDNPTHDSNDVSKEMPVRQQTNDSGPSAGNPETPASPRESPVSSTLTRPPLLSNPSTASRQRWRNALRAAIRIPERAAGHDHTTAVVPPSPIQTPYDHSPMTPVEQAHTPLKQTLVSRFTDLVPNLRVLEPTQELAAHTALVKQLQFSPDGKFLATSR